MSKKVIIITGAASGIGKGIAERFASAGEQLLLVDINQTALEKTASAFESNYSDCEVSILSGDLTSQMFIEEISATCKSLFQRADVLINCAGVFPSTPSLEIKRNEWDKVFGLNVSSLFFLSQAIAELMIYSKVDGGNIINITSAASEVARPGVAHYCSSKAAVKMLTQVLALEWAPYGIRVNAVGPGLVETETLLETLNNEKAIAEHKEKISYSPLGRTAKINEIADVVYFISSNSASYVTGQNLLVDGGYSAGRVFKSFS